jgi:hypothetical protein
MNYVKRTPSPQDIQDENYQDNKDVVIQNQSEPGDNKTECWEEPTDFRKEMRDYVRKVIEERLEQGDLKQDLESIVEERLNSHRSGNQSRLSASMASTHRK